MATAPHEALPQFNQAAEDAVDQMLASALRREAPWDYFRQLREAAPVYFSRSRGIWFITGYKAVEAVLKSPMALLQFEKRMDAVRPDWRDHASSANVAPFIAFVDGAAHKRIRAPLSPAFAPREMEAFRLQIRGLVEAIVDKYIAAGGGSFADCVAFPLAEASLYEVFAFDGSKLPNARELVHRMQLGFEIDVTAEQLADADAAASHYRAFWLEEFSRIARDPSGNDMISQLLRNPDFTTYEAALIGESLFSGGFDSTALTMTTGMHLLMSHPEQIALARVDEAALAKIPDEILRLGSAIPMTLRVATGDFEVEGFTIRTDEVVSVVLGAANRDPASFSLPDQMDLTRSSFRSLAFSYGTHACLGQWLARIEMNELFKALITRTSHIEQIGKTLFRDRQAVRGAEDIWLKVTPA